MDESSLLELLHLVPLRLESQPIIMHVSLEQSHACYLGNTSLVQGRQIISCHELELSSLSLYT